MISYHQGRTLTDAMLAYFTIKKLGQYYPGFQFWYFNKVLPGILAGRDILLIAKDGDRIIGVALGKRDGLEVKLRCIRVDPSYKSKGIGIRLIEKMLHALDTDKPLCSVSQEMFHDFGRPFINYFNFNLTRVEKGIYRPRALEYVFNGSLGKESAL